MIKIYILISLFTFVVFFAQTINFALKLRHEYTQNELNSIKVKDLTALMALFKMVVLSFIPIFNLIVLYVFLFEEDAIMQKGREELEKMLQSAETFK